jgi:hypothetical protein
MSATSSRRPQVDAVLEVDLAAWTSKFQLHLAGSSRAAMMEQVVIGTVAFDAVISALRRLAHERHSALRLGSRTE